jgi:SAM-dependent methyltransferase
MQPPPFHRPMNVLDKNASMQAAMRAFNEAEKSPQWLDGRLLDELDRLYPPEAGARKDEEYRSIAGRKKAVRLLNAIGGHDEGLDDFLELGCGDGAVCETLARNGKRATGIDIDGDAFSNRASVTGALFIKMDVSHLEFRDASFDCIFSFDSFEHFADPASALKQAIRVLRPDGLLYFSLGPIYNSPRGLHSRQKLAIPYRQHLFPIDLLQRFVKTKNRGLIEVEDVNKWSLGQYRRLWNLYASRLLTLDYREIPTYKHVALIEKYPTCFRSKVDSFEELVVADIVVLFKKT